MAIYNADLERFQNEFDAVKKDCANFDDKLLFSKCEILGKLAGFEQMQKDRELKLESSLEQLNSLDSDHNSRLDNNASVLSSINSDIVKLYQNDLIYNEKFDNLTDKKCDKSAYARSQSILKDDMNKLKLSLEQTKVDLRDTESYITVYKPMNEFKQIVSILDHVITDKNERERLVQFVRYL
jgi:hypothetical protein